VRFQSIMNYSKQQWWVLIRISHVMMVSTLVVLV